MQKSLKDVEASAPTMLPYIRWHDYCKTSYFIPEYGAKLNFSASLERLSRVTETEVASKFEQLRRVRDAFVFRRDSTFQSPTAPHFILADACAAAKCAAQGQACSRPTPPDLSACTLV